MTRDAIRDAAIEVASEMGFAAMTTEKVAERAVVSPSTVYRYFIDRDFGKDTPPAWYLNFRAHPHAEFRTRTGVERVVARELTDLEREELWPRLLKHHPIWGACQSCTDRQIALVALERPQDQEPA